MSEKVTIEQLEGLIAHNEPEIHETEINSNLSSLTATIFGIAGSLGGEVRFFIYAFIYSLLYCYYLFLMYSFVIIICTLLHYLAII